MCLLSQGRRVAKGQTGWVIFFLEVPLYIDSLKVPGVKGNIDFQSYPKAHSFSYPNKKKFVKHTSL